MAAAANQHAETILLVAITATTRKVVIPDATIVDLAKAFAIGFMVTTLCGGYYLIRRTRAINARCAD
ncbi:MAG: phosphate-starvation-inducible PsiE family protein [Woeseiaceae bacterium]